MPRQTTELGIEVSDVQKAMDDLQALALSIGGRQIDNTGTTQGETGQTTGKLTIDLPLDRLQSLIVSADGMGTRRSRQTSIDSHAPEGRLSRARLTVSFTAPAPLATSEEGMWTGMRRGLSTSLSWLSKSFTIIIVGLCVVVPWLALMWGAWRLVKLRTATLASAGAMHGLRRENRTSLIQSACLPLPTMPRQRASSLSHSFGSISCAGI